MSLTQPLSQTFLLAFAGHKPSQAILEAIQQHRCGGVTLFRHHNIDHPAQIRALTNELQTAARLADLPPLLIAADQETGQLQGLGEQFTAFPGNMALAAIGETDLAEQVGEAIGRECAAVGVNLNYAPVCDLNTNPANPNIGVRSFSDQPALAAVLASALIKGMQRAGVAATAKHFPGLGEAAVDSHYSVPVLEYNRQRLDEIELRPFQTAITAGVKLMMTAHVGLPAVTHNPTLPATLSHAVMTGLLRHELGFEGVIVSDAMEMGAIAQGGIGQVIDSISALRAGVNLLLLNDKIELQQQIWAGLNQALDRGLLEKSVVELSCQRVLALKKWLAGFEQPGLEVVGCLEHQKLAQQVAERSLTLVKDTAGLLPLRLKPQAKVLFIAPRPADLTPADTSSYLSHTLAAELRSYHSAVDEFILSQEPTEAEIRTVLAHAAGYDFLLLGSISASLNPAQADCFNQLLALGKPAVTVALRTPYDLLAYPQTSTHICTYNMHRPSMKALAAALFGKIPFTGQLPVQLEQLSVA